MFRQATEYLWHIQQLFFSACFGCLSVSINLTNSDHVEKSMGKVIGNLLSNTSPLISTATNKFIEKKNWSEIRGQLHFRKVYKININYEL